MEDVTISSWSQKPSSACDLSTGTLLALPWQECAAEINIAFLRTSTVDVDTQNVTPLMLHKTCTITSAGCRITGSLRVAVLTVEHRASSTSTRTGTGMGMGTVTGYALLMQIQMFIASVRVAEQHPCLTASPCKFNDA